LFLGGTVVAPALLAWRGGHLHFVKVLATSGAIRLPTWITLGALAVVLGAGPILRLSVIPTVLRNALEKLIDQLSLTILVGAAGGLVGGWCCWHLVHVIQTHGFGWQLWAIIAAAAGFPLYLLFGDRR